jgi:hypothetical protein
MISKRVCQRMLVLFVFMTLALVPWRAEAGTVTTYSDFTSFANATTGLTDVSFGGIVGPGAFLDFPNPGGYTDPTTGTNFAFPGQGGTDINVTSATYYTASNSVTYPLDFLVGAQDVLQSASEVITLPTASTAVGLFISTINGAGTPLLFTLSNGDTYLDSSPPAFGSVGYLGITDTTAFSSVTVTAVNGDNLLILMDFKYGTAAVPEPSTASLLAISIGCLGLAQYRRRRRRAV